MRPLSPGNAACVAVGATTSRTMANTATPEGRGDLRSFLFRTVSAFIGAPFGSIAAVAGAASLSERLELRRWGAYDRPFRGRIVDPVAVSECAVRGRIRSE